MNEIKSRGKTSDKIVTIVSSLLKKMKQLRAEFEGIKGEVELLQVAPSAENGLKLLMLMICSRCRIQAHSPSHRRLQGRLLLWVILILLRPVFAHTIRQLVEDVGLLKASTEDMSIKFAHLDLRNLNECGAWITTQFKDFRYGLIMDPLVMLDRIFGEDEASSSTHLKTMETRINLKIATGAEAATLRSLQFVRPRIFHSGRAAMNNG